MPWIGANHLFAVETFSKTDKSLMVMQRVFMTISNYIEMMLF